MASIDAPPIQDSVVELSETDTTRRTPFYMAKTWIQWIQNSLVPRVQAAPQVLKRVQLTNQSTSIGATAVPLASLASGQYRLTYYVRVTVADGVSSSIQVTLRWTEGAVALALSGVALATDTVTTVQSGSITVEADQNSSLSYSTTYASNTPAKMRYRLTVFVESIPALS